MNAVLDASALLAWLQAEPGAEMVEAELASAATSSLNWSEVLQKSLVHGVEITGLREDMEALGLAIVPFDVDDAEQTARLWSSGSGLPPSSTTTMRWCRLGPLTQRVSCPRLSTTKYQKPLMALTSTAETR